LSSIAGNLSTRKACESQMSCCPRRWHHAGSEGRAGFRASVLRRGPLLLHDLVNPVHRIAHGSGQMCADLDQHQKNPEQRFLLETAKIFERVADCTSPIAQISYRHARGRPLAQDDPRIPGQVPTVTAVTSVTHFQTAAWRLKNDSPLQGNVTPSEQAFSHPGWPRLSTVPASLSSSCSGAPWRSGRTARTIGMTSRPLVWVLVIVSPVGHERVVFAGGVVH
jgi:hypothetical protein